MKRLRGGVRVWVGALVVSVSATFVPVVGVLAATSTGSTTISGTVLAVRKIVVDDEGQIIQIVSNTPTETTPTVVYGFTDGAEMAYTPDVRRQYLALEPSIDFSHYGTVYERGSAYLPPMPLRAWDVVGRGLF